jgi:RHS repeat-associated protein
MKSGNSRKTASRSYGYDDASQLVEARYGTGILATGEFYGYDDNGNRTYAGNVETGPFPTVVTALDNRLQQDANFTYEYDGEGNLLKRTGRLNTNLTTEYAWDQRNRLTSVIEKNGGSVTKQTNYVYDAENRRVERSFDADGGTPSFTNEYFVYDGSNLSMRFGNAQELTHRYLYGPETGQVLADEVFKTVGSARVHDVTLWQIADQQGTVRDVVDESGTLRKHVDYDSFGRITAEQNYSAAIDQVFYYTGQELDKGTGLYNYNARWYDPAMARFISEDPSGFDGGDANLFRYVGNDPINNTDPTGLFQAGNPVQSLYATPNATDYSAWSRSQPDWNANVGNGLSAAQFTFGLRDYQDKLSRESDIMAHNMELGAIRGVDSPVARAISKIPDPAYLLVNPRVQGTLLVGQGIAEYALAGSVAGGTGGLATPLSLVIALNATDNVMTGANQVWTGQPQESVKHKALNAVGGRTAADIGEPIVNAVVDFGGGMYVPAPTFPKPGQYPSSFPNELGEYAPSSNKSFLQAEDPRVRPGYDPGAGHLDHPIADVFGGQETRATPAAMNLRKGGLEGELRKYENYLIRNGMKATEARQVIGDEIQSLSRDVNAAPFSNVFKKGFTLNDIDQ